MCAGLKVVFVPVGGYVSASGDGLLLLPGGGAKLFVRLCVRSVRVGLRHPAAGGGDGVAVGG